MVGTGGVHRSVTVRTVQLRASEVARATGGTLIGDDVVFAAVSIDSRLSAPGSLFVALRAGRDGHGFVGDAVAAGATGCLCDHPVDAPVCVVVPDTAVALRQLGAYARSGLGDRVVGITGSVGKTSTKDLAASVLGTRYATWANKRSFNNELGVPLTLLGAPSGTEATVVEMGMAGFGHIAELCEVARPTVGVVTAVALVHTSAVGDLDGVQRAKQELVEHLPVSGYAVLNADDPRVAAMAPATDARVVTFGSGGHVSCDEVTLGDDLRPRFRLESDWGAVDVEVAARGVHQVHNALAAATVGLLWGVDLAGVAEGLASAELSPWRMEMTRAPGGALIINDAYNANPTAAEAALRSLVAVPAHRHIAALGTMADLGVHSEVEHRRIAEVAAALGVRLVAVAEPAYAAAENAADPDEAIEVIGPLGPGDAVLVKASRSAGLERLAAALVAD